MTEAEKQKMLDGFDNGKKVEEIPDPWDEDAIRAVADKILQKIGERSTK